MAIISKFDPWKSLLCTCPAKLSLSPYVGCLHGCLYCYATSYIRSFHKLRAKADYLSRVSTALKKIPAGATITIANSSDAYCELEKKLKLMPATIRLMQKYPLGLLIVTKSDLVIRDIPLLKNLTHCVVALTITTLDDKLSSRLEPNAPLPRSRLKALEKISKHMPTIARIDPLIYPVNTKQIKEIVRECAARGVKQIITSTYKSKPDNFKRMHAAFPEYKEIWLKLYTHQGEKIAGYHYLPRILRKKLIEEVRAIVLDEGLEFSTCREGFADMNTTNCDGSAFFKT